VIKRLESSTTPFAENTRKLLTKMSPLSIAVVFEQIKRGRSMSIHDVFKMEFRMAQGFMHHTEFFEGVRALLVDKDKNPKWLHKHVSEVKQTEVDYFFDYPVDNNLDILKF
jgi:enoyl-CoA hydratase/carnithine racemase